MQPNDELETTINKKYSAQYQRLCLGVNKLTQTVSRMIGSSCLNAETGSKSNILIYVIKVVT